LPAGGVYRVAVTPADVGSRVSVRRVLRDGREGVGDVVGSLESWASGVLAIRRRDGSVVSVAESDLLAARVVPEAVPRGRPPDMPPVPS
jgi:hypothetical protein